MKVAQSSDIATKTVEMPGAKGVAMRLLIGKADEAPNFAMRMFEVQPLGHTPLHAHSHEHEIFVLEGEGVVVCEGAEYRIYCDSVVFLPGGKEHQFRNTGKGLLRFLCLVPASAV